jgi:cell division protein FtsB
LILYLALNAVTGRQGLISFVQLQQSERELIAQRAELAQDAAALRARIRELAEASLDPDALEELAHRQIGAVRGDEMVFELAQSPVTKTQ